MRNGMPSSRNIRWPVFTAFIGPHEQPFKLNFSFGGHLATNSLGLVAKGFFLGPKMYVNN